MMSTQNSNMNIAIVGAGAAGLFAAGTAIKYGANVTLYEHNAKLGRKLLITGKGRCNVTNNCTKDEFITNVVSNPRFMYTAIDALTPQDLMAIIEENGTAVKTERGRRVFPISDKSSDILAALLNYAKGAKVVHAHITDLWIENKNILGVKTTDGSFAYDKVIVATGGITYPLTGSDGSGYEILRRCGHTITDLCPSLVPLVCKDDCSQLQGLSLKNVTLSLFAPNHKKIQEEFGEMLFTHYGVSGPLVLSASAYLKDENIDGYTLEIDLKPALSDQQLNERILSDFNKYSNKDFANALDDLLPQKIIPVVINRCGIDPRKKVNSIKKEERLSLIKVLKHFSLELLHRRPLSEAVITRGGVKVQEVSPKTMESKICSGLYICGEILDVDAFTGGYNLQIAFSTAYLAGMNSAIS